MSDPEVPKPAHERREPLPWRSPKPIEEDPEAVKRVQAIINHPGYRQADQDIGFLNRPETRGVRLQLDYQKAELLLRQREVLNTIVVFGSTRIREPQAAKHRLDVLRAGLAGDPGNADLRRRVDVAERILGLSRYYTVARELGRLVGESGRGPDDSRLVVMTGGGPGMMEAANRGAYDVDALSIGLNIDLPHEQYPNPYLTPDLCFRFRYFGIRKMHFLLRTKALVAFPGGYGTLDELFETLTLVQTRKIVPVPVVLVGEAFWRRAVDIDFLVDQGMIDAEDRDLFWYAESAAEIWNGILDWHALNGAPLLSD